MKFLGEGPTRLLQPPSPRPSTRGFDLENTSALWNEPDGPARNDDPVECVRRAMLRHEHVFRTQLFELHRLYWAQNSLMHGSSYDQVTKHNNGVAPDWSAAHRMDSISGISRHSISSQTQMNLLPGWNVSRSPPRVPFPYSHHGFDSKLPHPAWLTTSETRLFSDGHTTPPENRYFRQPNRSSTVDAVTVKPEPGDLTFGPADCCNYYDGIGGRLHWMARFQGKGRESLDGGSKEVIHLMDDSSDSEECVDGEHLRAGQDCRPPEPFDMNHIYEQTADDYGCSSHSTSMQTGLDGTIECKTQKMILFDLNTIQYEDSSAVLEEAENNVPSSSAGSNIQSSQVVVNDRGRFSDPVISRVPNPKDLSLELNSRPDATYADDIDERPIRSSNGSSSISETKLCCWSGGKYPGNTVEPPASDSRETGSVTDLPGAVRLQPSLESTNLSQPIGRDVGSMVRLVDGERSEEDTVSSRMHRIPSLSPDGKSVVSSLEQVQGGQQLSGCAFRDGNQCGKSHHLFAEGDLDTAALIGNNDGLAIQQLSSAVSNNACSRVVAENPVSSGGDGESAPAVNSPDIDDQSCLHSKVEVHCQHQQDSEMDVMLLTAAETLAHIFKNRETPSSFTRGSSDAAARQEFEEEEMEPMDSQQPECSRDSYERIVLALPECQEDEWSSPPDGTNKAWFETAATGEGRSGLRFNTRRGRQLRNFQKDILPGIVSLSRHEICEDMHAFTEIVKFEELKRRGGRPGRGTNRGIVGTRGSAVRKKRSRTSPFVQRR